VPWAELDAQPPTDTAQTTTAPRIHALI
jgi:hypothetical protein